jgi:IclR family transcriptional regulator, KDG regulon repressor
MDLGQVLYVDKRNAARPVEMFARPARWARPIAPGWARRCWPTCPPEALEQALARQSFHRHTPAHADQPAALMAELKRFAPAAMPSTGKSMNRESSAARCRFCPGRARVLGALSVTSTTARTTLDALEALVPR